MRQLRYALRRATRCWRHWISVIRLPCMKRGAKRARWLRRLGPMWRGLSAHRRRRLFLPQAARKPAIWHWVCAKRLRARLNACWSVRLNTAPYWPPRKKAVCRLRNCRSRQTVSWIWTRSTRLWLMTHPRWSASCWPIMKPVSFNRLRRSLPKPARMAVCCFVMACKRRARLTLISLP